MKISGLMVAVVILAGLAGALYWSNHHQPAVNTDASTDLPPKILSLASADIEKLAIKKKDGNDILLDKNGAGKWQMTAPQPLPVDQDAASGVLTTLSSLGSDRLVDAKASNLQQYGLADPSLEIDISEKNNKNQKLLFGDNTPTGSDVYAALSGDPRVFTVAAYEKSSIDKTPNDLRDKRLLTVEPDKVSRVEIVSKQQAIEFGRNKDGWQILKPKPLRANSVTVGDLVRDVTGARMELSGTDQDAKKVAAGFTSGSPVATAKLTDEAGTQELQVRKSKDDYYAKSSVVPGVYKVSSSVGQALDKKLDDFRNKSLFDFGYSDPGKIEMHAGSKSYFFTKSGDDWWSGNSKKMDIGGVQTLIDDIRDLSASKFVDSGFAAPVVDLTVISNGGKRVERVSISKSRDQYIAKRENEPALYQLDSSRVEDLEKAADDVKPSAATPKK